MSSTLCENAIAVGRAVQEDRLWSNLMEMAKIGARDDGGVNRQALSLEDREARALLISWARERGYAVAVDPAANLFIRRGGDGDPVLIGSHMDSQPAGGRFDGIYGVLAAFETLVAMDDANISTQRPVELVAWTNEEGGRFAAGCTGSISWAGVKSLDSFLDVVGADGVTMRDALEETIDATPDIDRRTLGGAAHAYVEPHIEQGPVLEARGLQIAAVTSIQGLRWYRVEVTGEAGHAGTSPMEGRKDAIQGALRAIVALNELMLDPTDTVRFTVGRMEIEPNSPNTIPSKVSFTIDFRHPDEAVLEERAGQIAKIVAAATTPCSATVTQTSASKPGVFPEHLVGLIEGAAQGLDLGVMRLPSGAFHDALFVSQACPSGMIFIPCVKGISHHPSEYSSPEDCAAGARVLAACAAQLALEG